MVQIVAGLQRQHGLELGGVVHAEGRALRHAGDGLVVRQLGDEAVFHFLPAGAAAGLAEICIHHMLRLQHMGLEVLHERIVPVLLAAGERCHHERGFQPDDVERLLDLFMLRSGELDPRRDRRRHVHGHGVGMSHRGRRRLEGGLLPRLGAAGHHEGG